MFGKKSHSSNDRFVMAQGRKAGNVKSVPRAKVASEPMKPTKLPSADAMKRGVKVNQNPPQSKGKANTFKTTGVLRK
jgi:hypothetical protein